MTIRRVILGSTGVLSGALLLSSGQVAAQQSASAQAMLEEVVVTARRREENLQDLPLSIAAISADAMEAQGIYTIEQISDFVPNVTLTTSDRANNTRVVIRGIGGGHPDPVFVFGSGMYIDGHYIPNSLGGYMSTMDIERVELLRGPQGTLFGKNVTGGAVNIITTKPGPEFESSLTLRAAEDGQQDFRGMVNVPISDNVFARFGVATEQYDGYYTNRNLGIDTGGTDMQSVNAALRFTPGDNWTIDASLNIIEREDDNAGIQCNPADGSAPQWGGGAGHLERVYVGFKQDYFDACASDAAQGPFVNSSDKLTFADLDTDSVFLSAQWDSDGAVGGLDNLTFKANGSYRKTDLNYLQDRDASFYAIDAIGEITDGPGLGVVGQDNTTRGAEFLIEAAVNDRFEFTVGVNWFYELAKNGDGSCRNQFIAGGGNLSLPNPALENWDGTGDIPDPLIAVNPGYAEDCAVPSGLHFELLPQPRINGGGPGPFLNTARVENESVAVFGHATYVLSDNWTMDFGARWTEDDREYWNMEWASSGCAVTDQSTKALGNPAAAADQGHCTFTAPMTWNSVVNEGFFNTAQDTFSEVTPMISLTRNLEGGNTLDSGMFYVLYSEGFLTGGFNAEVNANVPAIESLLTYEPEHVENYEVGFKGTFADGRLRIMVDYFFMDYTDKQDSINIDNPDGAFGIDDPLGVVQNVSTVDIDGIELELRAVPWDGGFISVDFGYLQNEYGEYRYQDPATGIGFIDETNTTIADLTPEWTLNLGIEHQFSLASGATITPRLNIYSQDDYDYRSSTVDAPPSFCNQESYTKVGARLTYVPAAGNWRASVFGENINDELIYESCGASRGVYRYRYERPAYWGAQFTMNWGQ